MNTPEISYKTECHVVIRDGMDIKNAAALHWRKGAGERVEISVGSTSIKLTASQLEQIVQLAPAVIKDVRPEGIATSFPTGLGGVR